MASLGEAVVDVGADTSGFRTGVEDGVNSALANASKSMKNLGKGMQSVGTKLTAGVTLPLVGIAAQAVKTASEFETTMNVLQANTGASKSQMKALQAQAKQLGVDTVYSAGEAADAMLELGKAGQSTSQIMDSVPAVLNLAATEGMGLADAAGTVTSVMSQFQIKAADSADAVNALAGASNASKASVATVAEAMKMVGPAAASMGYNVQDTAAALAALANNGLEGGIAGTSLASMFNHLIPQTKKSSDAMKALGLNFVDSKGKFDSISTVADKMQKTFGKMAPAARKVALSKIFGNDASVISAVNAMINTGSKGLKQYAKATNDTSAASKLANARMSGTAGAIERMKGSLDTAMLSIGQALAPTITQIANIIGKLVDKFTSLSPSVQKVVIIFGAVAAAIGPVLIIVGTLITSIGAIAGVLGGLTAVAAAPIAAIGLIVGALALLLIKSQAARDVVSKAFQQIKAAVMPAVQQISDMFTTTLIPAFVAISPYLEAIGVLLLKVFSGAVVGAIKGVINVIVGIVTVITGVVNVVKGILTGDWSLVWQGLGQIVSGALQAVIGIIQVWWNAGVPKVFKLGFSLLTGAIRAGWGAVRGLFSSGVSALRGAVNNIPGLLAAPFRAAWAAVRAVASAMWSGLRSLFSGGGAAIRGAVSSAFGALRGLAARGLSAMRGAVSSGISGVMGLIRGIPGKITGILDNLGGLLKNAGAAILQGLIDGINDKVKDLKGLLNKVTGWIPDWKGPAKKDKVLLFKAGQQIMGGLTKGLKDGSSGVQQYLSDLTSYLKEHGEKQAAKVAKGFKDNFAKIGTVLDSVNAKLDTAKQNLEDAQKTLSDYSTNLATALSNTGDAITGGHSAKQIITSLTKQAAQTKQFSDVLTTLKGMGLNANAYDEIAQAGPSALSAAQALIKGGQSAINQVNALQGQINQYAVTAGTTASNYLYKAGVSAAQGVVDGLQSQSDALNASMDALGQRLAAAISKAVNATTAGVATTKAQVKADNKKQKAKAKAKRKHAAGTLATLGGSFLAGENGPELVRAPARSRVYNARETENLARNSVPQQAGDTVVVNQNYYGPTTSGGRLREIDWTIRYASKARRGSTEGVAR